MKAKENLGRELRRYARSKGLMILDHTVLTPKNMSCAVELVDSAEGLREGCPPDEAIVAWCDSHDMCIAMEVIRRKVFV